MLDLHEIGSVAGERVHENAKLVSTGERNMFLEVLIAGGYANVC